MPPVWQTLLPGITRLLQPGRFDWEGSAGRRALQDLLQGFLAREGQRTATRLVSRRWGIFTFVAGGGSGDGGPGGEDQGGGGDGGGGGGGQARGAYHLPDHVRWTQVPHARRNKAGRYYLIIPFSHPGLLGSSGGGRGVRRQTGMPWRLWLLARRLRPGEYLTAGPTQGRGMHAPGMQPYVPNLPQNIRPGYQHASIYQGLRRMPRTRGRGRYLTFRTMTQESPGWWIPLP
jgi:hypothetical protein